MAAKDLGFDQRCYERALALSELRYDDSADDAAFDFVIGQIDECERLVGEYVEGNGYKSEAVRGVRGGAGGVAVEVGGGAQDRVGWAGGDASGAGLVQ